MSSHPADDRVSTADPSSVSGFVADTIPFSIVDGPGNRFAVFLQGCNFDCVACHNPQTIPGHAPVAGHRPRHRTVAELLVDVRRAAPFVSGITVSGGEATQQPRFVRALFAAVRSDPDLAHLTCFVDSNGACTQEVWEELLADGLLDGAMIDLKCIDPSIHEAMTGRSNDQVLASIRFLAARDALYEVRLLLVAGTNDDPSLLRRTGEWLAGVDPAMRLKVIGFRPHGTRPHDPPLVPPTPDQLDAATDVLRSTADFRISVVGTG